MPSLESTVPSPTHTVPSPDYTVPSLESTVPSPNHTVPSPDYTVPSPDYIVPHPISTVYARSQKRPISSAADFTENTRSLKRPVSSSTNDDSTVFFLDDVRSNIQFLVDTGACRSLLPKPFASASSRGSNVRLRAANGSPIETYGVRTLDVSVSGNTYSWDFIIADVTLPILGADFLGHFKLLVDVHHRRLVNLHTLVCTIMSVAPSDMALHLSEVSDNYGPLRSEFPAVFRPELRPVPGSHPPHGVYHFITTTGPPVFSRFRRLAPDRFAAAKKVFQDMERLGICQKASSPWASPLHLVNKKDGSLRPCGDYRRLNVVTEPDHYPLPNIADVTSFLHGSKIFSTLDLLKGYYQVPMNPADIPKTAVTTPFGTFTFNFSCFGLRNAGATFQRMMDDLLGDLPFCVAYIDDILIFSTTPEEHLQHLRIILDRLQSAGLVLRHDKCVFGVNEVDFLGHRISAKGVRPLPAKVSAVRDFPVPNSVKSLQEFIGMINYYHRFVPHLASTMAPLYLVLQGKPKSLEWGPPQDAAFAAAKKALASATYLQFPKPGASLILSTDASDVAIGAVLEQVIHGRPQPLAFFSRKLSPTEARYSTFDRELLAVFSAVRHFRHFLTGATFTIQTDHMPLVHAFTKKTDPISPRQQRHLSAIAEYNCTLRHVPGKNNPVADALSRNAISTVSSGIDYTHLASLQQQYLDDPELHDTSSSLEWHSIPLDDAGNTVICDTSSGRPRPWVPPPLRRQVFDCIHGISHPSARSTTQLLRQKFIWHGLAKDAKAWARSCIACQSSKVHRHTESGVGTFHPPERRFSHIHVDVVGPLPPSEDHRYLLTIVDRSTRWPEAIPMKSATADSCAAVLVSHWISRFGVPLRMTSDRGSNFTSSLWASLTKLIGTTHHLTTAYNPEANGLVERMHRTLKAALMTRCIDASWTSQLPWVLLGLRTTPRDDSNLSVAELVYGDPLVVPAEFFPCSSDTPDLSRLRAQVGRHAPFKQSYQDTRTKYVPPALASSTHVFLRIDSHRPPLSPPYAGPYKILRRKTKSLLLDVKGAQEWISIDRVKPAFLPSSENPPIKFSCAGRPLVSSKGGAL